MIYKKIEIKVDGYKETADLYTYFLDNSIEMNINRKRPVVVICPGGGYTMTSDREAEPIAMQYLAKGYHSVILRYSVEPARYPLALFLHAASVFIACLFICKTQSMSANRIKMHLYRYFQFAKCVKKQQRILYRNTVIRHCMPQECWRCISGYLEFQGLFFSFIQIIIILSKQTFKRSCMCKFTGSNYRIT